MKKLADLRDFLTAALPFVAREPERLQLFADEGQVAATLGAGLSFELRYKITGQLWDFAGHPDAVFVPLLAWIAQKQPELLASYKTNPDAITWRAEVLDASKVDLEFALNVTERVRVTPRADGTGYDAEHEPDVPHRDDVRHWALYLKDELLAEWDAPAGELFP